MKHIFPKKRLLTAFVMLFAAAACVDSAYDLGNISLKITLGPNGLTLPLGKIDSLTVDSLMRRSEIENLITEDGYYAYKLDDVIDESIDSIVIDPIRDVMPAIAPYVFKFTEASLPETVGVDGFRNQTPISLPSFDITDQNLPGKQDTRDIGLNGLGGTTPADGSIFSLPELSSMTDLELPLKNIPVEIASIERIYFDGNPLGTPLRINFALGTLAQSVRSGSVSLTITLPAEYELQLGDTYGGAASVNGNRLTLTNCPIPSSGAGFVFYIASRNTASETITPQRTLGLDDEIHYTFTYTGTSNGHRIPADAKPVFRLSVAPSIGDADLLTNTVTPAPSSSVTDVTFGIDDLGGISRVEYVAFTDNPSNALVMHAAHDAIPLKGAVPVRITFPAIYDFKPGIDGLSGNVLHTDLDKLSAGLRLPLRGIRLTGSDADVVDGRLSVTKPIEAVASPSFPGDAYRMSAIETDGALDVTIDADDMTLHIDQDRSGITAGFSEPVDIDQPIDQTFATPDEVGSIHIAQVVDADNGSRAILDIDLDLQDPPVDHCYFDNIEIILPAFLVAEHPNLDPETNIVHIDRAEYKGKAVTIASITVTAIKDVPVGSTPEGKEARLKGSIRITTTANLPEDSPIDDPEQTEIILLPEATLSPLKITHVTGEMDVDLQKYLKPTTIDLDDISETIGEQDVEINLIAPQIFLTVSNPVGVTMVGDIVMQPYDTQNKQLDPVVVKNVTIDPAETDDPHITKLFVTDLDMAPEGYTLCRVDDLSKLVKVIPAKIDITFDMEIDKTKEQRFAITGKDYPLTIDYVIKLPLKFKDDAHIRYSDTTDVKKTFEDLKDYEITAEDILVEMTARSTLPIGLDLKVDMLDAEGKEAGDVKAVVLNRIKGYDPETDGEFAETPVEIRLDIKDGDIQRLTRITTIRYTIEGDAVGSGAGLIPDQRFEADLKLKLKKGISLDLEDL